MSLTTKLVTVIVGVLLLALAGETVYIQMQHAKMQETTDKLIQLNQRVEEANRAVKTQAVVSDVTDEVVTTATKRITTNTQKGAAIKAVVDNVTKRVANEEISNTVASAAYTNSMWDAYCTAEPSNSACSAR